MPLILGLLLGKTADNGARTIESYDSFWQIFTRPIVLILAVASIACIFGSMLAKKRGRQRLKT